MCKTVESAQNVCQTRMLIGRICKQWFRKALSGDKWAKAGIVYCHMILQSDAFPLYKEIVNNNALVDEPDSTRSVLFSQETLGSFAWNCSLFSQKKCVLGKLYLKLEQ